MLRERATRHHRTGKRVRDVIYLVGGPGNPLMLNLGHFGCRPGVAVDERARALLNC